MNEAKILISVVTYNSSNYIKECIDAILRQTYSHFVLVIFDNHSVDDTSAIVNQYNDHRIHFHQGNENIGFGRAHNWVIDNFDSEFILVLNPDAILTKSYLENALPYFEIDERIGSIASLLFSDHGDNPLIDCAGITFTRSRRFKLRLGGMRYKSVELGVQYVDGVNGAAGLYRRKAIKSVSIDNEVFDSTYFLYGEDWDLSWRLQLGGWKCLFVPEAVGCHYRNFKQRSLSERKKVSRDIKYHSLKNSIVSIIKNDDPRNFLFDILFISKRFILVFVYSLFFELYSLRAIPYIISNLRRILKLRKKIQIKRKVSSEYIRNEFILERSNYPKVIASIL